MNLWTICRFELRNMTRQRSFYTFLLLWVVVMSLVILIQQNIPNFGNYTNVTGTMFNLILYLLPLLTLVLSSFSITNERESGQWKLLLSYPVSSWEYLIGKFLGQFIAQWIILTGSLGFTVGLSPLFGVPLTFTWVLAVYLFAILLLFFFLLLGMLVGVQSATRWQALMRSIAIWFVLIMIWPIILISVLSFLPYPMIESAMKVILFINPAEWIRVWMVIQLNGGAVFGQTYDALFQSFQSWNGWLLLVVYMLVYTSLIGFITKWMMERNKTHG
ncbi:ABC transporter permease [Hazenella coriacea]|uniref:Cu-processing system permease protein n=1 Tax=Hazenella coriacea TaxID=1179467 RepID=A0A4R3L7X3_9BACL|nr:ABC transporter permease subunit [Hazenella coriacea]TCS93606.1 Cu-processing system permease protein [Hazenella coriacea]